jgi:hypothetical protein
MDWARHALRINDLIDNHVRDLRQRALIDSYIKKTRQGTYWATRSNMAKFPAPNTLPCPFASTQELAALPTRLASLDDRTQQRLINWGYAICDAALRLHLVPSTAAPTAFPIRLSACRGGPMPLARRNVNMKTLVNWIAARLCTGGPVLAIALAGATIPSCYTAVTLAASQWRPNPSATTVSSPVECRTPRRLVVCV